MTPFSRHLAAAAAAAALALPVWAQTAPAAADPATTSAATTPNAERQAKRQQWQEKRAARHAERLAQLKQQLAITPAQEPAWTRFTAAMQPERNTQQRPSRADMEKLSTPERIDRMRELRKQRTTAMDARLDATKAFYAELQPEQQRSFDRVSARMFKGGERHGKHHHGRHMQGGPAA